MAEASSPTSMFSIEEFPVADKDAVFPKRGPASFTGGDEHNQHKSSPNLRWKKEGKEPRQRTESASGDLERDKVAELHQFRSRSRSAPSSLMVAARYGRELRRMSDEFDQIFTSLPRPKSAGAASKMTESKSFAEMFMNIWRRKNKDKSDSVDGKQ